MMPKKSSKKRKRGRPRGSVAKSAKSAKRRVPGTSAAIKRTIYVNHTLFVRTNKEFAAAFNRDLLNYWGPVKGFHFGEFCEKVLGTAFIIAAVRSHKKFGRDAAAVIAALTHTRETRKDGNVTTDQPKEQKNGD